MRNFFFLERQHGWGEQAGAGRKWTRFSSHLIGLWERAGGPGLLVWTLLSLYVNWEQLVKMFRRDGQYRHNYINPRVEDLRHVKCFPTYYLFYFLSNPRKVGKKEMLMSLW